MQCLSIIYTSCNFFSFFFFLSKLSPTMWDLSSGPQDQQLHAYPLSQPGASTPCIFQTTAICIFVITFILTFSLIFSPIKYSWLIVSVSVCLLSTFHLCGRDLVGAAQLLGVNKVFILGRCTDKKSSNYTINHGKGGMSHP